MYEPAHFRVEERAELIAFIQDFPLGLLILQGEEGPSADLVPFLVDEDARSLRAHVARANPLVRRLAAPSKALVVFSGPDAYVSPSLYPSKAGHGKVVPTWNYAMAQVSGAARLREEPEWIEAQVTALTAQQEAGRPRPWTIADAPRDFIDAQLRGKYKLSQNRTDQDRLGVSDGLATETGLNAQATARLMRSR